MGLFEFLKKKPSENVVVVRPVAVSDFPAEDKNGRKALTVREADIYGVSRSFGGVSAQDIISGLSIGDSVVLDNSKTGDAVRVLSSDMKQFGFLPEWKDANTPKVKYEVHKSLEQGATVLARVKRKYTNNNGSVGVVIDICRYSAR